MTSVAKIEFGPVRRNRLSPVTNNYVDEAQLQLCYFARLPELCGRNRVARKAAMICFQKFDSPSGVVRKLAIICGQKSNLPSCVARKAAMICGQKFNSPSGVVLKKLAIICGQKFNSPSWLVRKLVMISGRKSNYLSYLARHLAMISGRKCNYAGYVARNLAAIFRQMSGKFVTESHTRLPLKASVNSFHCLEYEKELAVCGCSVICNAEEDPKIEITEKSYCLSVIARHLKRIRSVTRENQRRKRDREPSRIPVRKVLKVLKRKLVRKKNRIILKNSVPHNSFIRFLCCNYKYLCMWHEREHFFSKYVFFFKNLKICHADVTSYNSNKHREEYMYVPLSALKSQRHVNSTVMSTLKGGVFPDENVRGTLPWDHLSDKLKHISLMPYDVGGSGDCFFRSVSHQLYGTADLHFQIRLSGIAHLNNHPELYVESIVDDTWENYVKQMSNSGTWCDNVIIQAVANSHNCVIHITESDFNKPDGTIIYPASTTYHEKKQTVIFIGYINGFHYVSTVPLSNCGSSSRLAYLKRKLSWSKYHGETSPKKKRNSEPSVLNEARQMKLAKQREYNAKKWAKETDEEKRKRLEKQRGKHTNKRAQETDQQKQIRLAQQRAKYAQKRAEETEEEKKLRLAKQRENMAKKRAEETDQQKNIRLAQRREKHTKKVAEEAEELKKLRLAKRRETDTTQKVQESTEEKQERLEKKKNSFRNTTSLQTKDATKDNLDIPLMERKQVLQNIDLFHKSNEYIVKQCIVCLEAWPLKLSSCSVATPKYLCLRCSRDKKQPQRFSKENNMIPSKVPPELQGLTQVEEMLIARALPLISVYLKPGGQRGYSGHCINLPQHVEELASSLPRLPRELSVIVVKIKTKDNNFKDLLVRRQKVADALLWLISNNPYYKDVKINQCSLNCLPKHSIPCDLISVERESQDSQCSEPDLGPQNEEDIVYNEETEMNSFLPIPQCEQQEMLAIQEQLSSTHHNVAMSWPKVDTDPLNEYKTPFLATMAFPTLFPDGKGDPTNPSLYQDVPLGEAIKHLLKYAENKDGKWTYRFASHPRFSYWAFNMIERKRILQQTGIFLKQNPGEAHLTIEELQHMATNNNSDVFLSKISRYLSNISGSNAYWFKARENLKAIISHVGPPTFFFTFSSADMHWPELHTLFGSQNNCTAEHRRQNVINNPHITDWFFTQRVENFIKFWLYNSLDAQWHWYRFEYQARGSIHCHGVAKLKNDPGLCTLSEKALKGYLAEISVSNADTADLSELNQQICDGKKASEIICQYVDWLVSTHHPEPPDNTTWIKPSIHPCQKHHKDIENTYNDYIDLLNTVQRHTRCSSNYCLRKRQNDSDLQCRFNFPFEPCPCTKLDFEPIHSKKEPNQYRVKIVTKRNDPRLNNHQRLQLQGWRANCDIQVVIDYHACVEYLAKYASKGEPRSSVMKSAFNSIVRNCDIQSNPTKLIKKVIMKSLGQRDFSAQETMHHLLSLKLVSSSFNVISISLNGSRKIKTNSPEGDVATNDSLLDVYANRAVYAKEIPNILNFNFISFATKYKLINKKLAAQAHNIVVRVFPVYSSNNKGPNFSLYCKYQLIRYKPWQTTQENAWGNQPGTDEIYITQWKNFLQTPYAKENVPDWHDKLDTVQNYKKDDTEIENTTEELPQREEWMLLADLYPTSCAPDIQSQKISNSDYNWQTDRFKYQESQIKQMSSWIKINRDASTQESLLQRENVDISTFSEMQKRAYDIIKAHSEQPSPKNSLLLIIIGDGGTGKSYLISAIKNLLQHSCAVTATTGKASYSIHGCTIHSLLKLPVGPKGNKDLSGQSLVRLQHGLKNIDYIVIDEYSMLGQKTLAWVDKRCRQATGLTDQLFGGISIIFVGDPGQLPPVADKPLYHSKPSSALQEQGQLAYFMFTTVVKLTLNHRVQGPSPEQIRFRDLLIRLRTGDCNQDDWKILLTRQPAMANNVIEFKDAIRLYYSNEEVAKYNFEKLLALQQPIAKINARHSSDTAKKKSPDEMSGLEPVIFLAKGAHVMLTMNLWTDVGLCNGATGIIVDFIYADNMLPPDLPIAVIVKFDDYAGPSLSNVLPGCVPICPITIICDISEGVHERQQLPLKLAWAITIHKSQGLTLSKAWIDIGKTERTPGITYVAVSRVRTLSSSIIEPMTFERLTSLKKSAGIQFRIQEENRLDKLSQNM